MPKLNHAHCSFLYKGSFSATLFILVFLSACSDKPKKSELKIHVFGKVTNKNDSSLMANVEVQLTANITKVLRTTNTNEDGQYSIIYYGKCNRGDVGTTLYVRVRPPEGYYLQPPSFYMLVCIEETQTFNFQLIPQPE